MSHPTWVRGLKQDITQMVGVSCSVAPYVGAWIETTAYHTKLYYYESHPTWVRGLKQKRTLKTPLP